MYKNTSNTHCTLEIGDKVRGEKVPEVSKGKLIVQVACDELEFHECFENLYRSFWLHGMPAG